MNDIHLTIGHIARHTPHGAGSQGRDAAIVDIAQDLLLRHLHHTGILDALAFKGGTSLRKLYAGSAGRFSLDLDFASVIIGADPDDALTDCTRAQSREPRRASLLLSRACMSGVEKLRQMRRIVRLTLDRTSPHERRPTWHPASTPMTPAEITVYSRISAGLVTY